MSVMDLPLFNGGDPEEWICAVEGYLCKYKIDLSQSIACVSEYFVGDANRWYTDNKQKLSDLDWCGFVYHLIWEFQQPYSEAEQTKSTSVNPAKDEGAVITYSSPTHTERNQEPVVSVNLTKDDELYPTATAARYDIYPSKVSLVSPIIRYYPSGPALKLYDELPQREVHQSYECCCVSLSYSSEVTLWQIAWNDFTATHEDLYISLVGLNVDECVNRNELQLSSSMVCQGGENFGICYVDITSSHCCTLSVACCISLCFDPGIMFWGRTKSDKGSVCQYFARECLDSATLHVISGCRPVSKISLKLCICNGIWSNADEKQHILDFNWEPGPVNLMKSENCYVYKISAGGSSEQCISDQELVMLLQGSFLSVMYSAMDSSFGPVLFICKINSTIHNIDPGGSVPSSEPEMAILPLRLQSKRQYLLVSIGCKKSHCDVIFYASNNNGSISVLCASPSSKSHVLCEDAAPIITNIQSSELPDVYGSVSNTVIRCIWYSGEKHFNTTVRLLNLIKAFVGFVSSVTKFPHSTSVSAYHMGVFSWSIAWIIKFMWWDYYGEKILTEIVGRSIFRITPGYVFQLVESHRYMFFFTMQAKLFLVEHGTGSFVGTPFIQVIILCICPTASLGTGEKCEVAVAELQSYWIIFWTLLLMELHTNFTTHMHDLQQKTSENNVWECVPVTQVKDWGIRVCASERLTSQGGDICSESNSSTALPISQWVQHMPIIIVGSAFIFFQKHGLLFFGLNAHGGHFILFLWHIACVAISVGKAEIIRVCPRFIYHLYRDRLQWVPLPINHAEDSRVTPSLKENPGSLNHSADSSKADWMTLIIYISRQVHNGTLVYNMSFDLRIIFRNTIFAKISLTPRPTVWDESMLEIMSFIIRVFTTAGSRLPRDIYWFPFERVVSVSGLLALSYLASN